MNTHPGLLLLLLCTGAVRKQLAGRVSKILVGMGRHLTRASSLRGGGGGGGGGGGHSRGGRGDLVERAQLRKALSDFHIHLPEQVHLCVHGPSVLGWTPLTEYMYMCIVIHDHTCVSIPYSQVRFAFCVALPCLGFDPASWAASVAQLVEE